MKNNNWKLSAAACAAVCGGLFLGYASNTYAKTTGAVDGIVIMTEASWETEEDFPGLEVELDAVEETNDVSVDDGWVAVDSESGDLDAADDIE